jgi:hypothetical protein
VAVSRETISLAFLAAIQLLPPRQRAVLILRDVVELRLLPANPIGLVRWRAPRAAVALSPATVPSPAQVQAILALVARTRPPGPRPRHDNPHRRLHAHRRHLDQHRHAVRVAGPQAPPRRHCPRHSHPADPGMHARRAPARVRDHAGRRLFRGARGGMLSEAVYGRAWYAARQAALGPDLAATAARR